MLGEVIARTNFYNGRPDRSPVWVTHVQRTTRSAIGPGVSVDRGTRRTEFDLISEDRCFSHVNRNL